MQHKMAFYMADLLIIVRTVAVIGDGVRDGARAPVCSCLVPLGTWQMRAGRVIRQTRR